MRRILRLNTIEGKIILSIIIIIAICVLFSVFIITQVVQDRLGEKYDIDKVAATESLSHSLAPLLDLYDYKQVGQIIASSLTYENIVHITVFNKGGVLIVSATERNVSPDDLDVEKYEITNNDKVIGSIEIGFSRGYISDQIQTTTGALVSSLAGFLILAGLALFIFIDRSVINPLGVFAKTIRGMDSENLSSRVNIFKEDEIGELARNFNQMAENLERSHSALQNTQGELQNELIYRTQMEEKYRTLTDNVDIGMYRTTPGSSGKFIELNPAMVKMFGYESREEMLSIDTADLYQNPEDRGRFSDKLSSEGMVREVELNLRKKDGTPIIGMESTIAVRDEKGKALYFDGVVADITERKQAEESIKHAAEEWRTTFDSIPDLISIHDKDFRLVRVNKAFADILNMKPKELVGKTCHQLVHGTNECVPDCPHVKTLETGKPAMAGYFEPRLGIHLEVSTSPIFDEKGKVIASIHVARDITERKQAEEELNKLSEELGLLNVELEGKVKERTNQLEGAMKDAEIANQAKSEFLANMSHELRTPLNAIIGFSQILGDEDYSKLKESERGYATNIYESGTHLLNLINDILDLAKVESGKMELELEPVKIKHLLEASTVMIKEKAFKHGIELVINIASDLEDFEIMADERKLKQITFNLLSNSAKFTPDGGKITIECKKDGKQLVVSVIDNGVGIAAEETEKVFEEFYQTKAGSKSKAPGTGLGLPLTKSFVEMHGGKIWVESEGKDKGSRFIFTIPIKRMKKT